MQLDKIPLSDTHAFSSFFLDYIQASESLKPFYHRLPNLESFGDQLMEKSSFPPDRRKVLVETLKRQYKKVTAPDPVMDNVTSLGSDKTFTVTTGHQLNIFTGPLYFIYKIVTVINTCVKLRKQHPGYAFVPVYWMASEDHDFAEICYFMLYGKKYQWYTEQTGAVGRFNPQSIESLFSEVPGDTRLFKDAYLKSETLSDAVRYYINELFGSEGLVVIDADEQKLKNFLTPVIEDDLFRHSTQRLVEGQNSKLKSSGHEGMVHVREINFFYLNSGMRNRIERDAEGFKVVDSQLRFTDQQMKDLIGGHPEKFSPNVLLRPLYQEMILPNLAYIGGPAEVLYWLQLKSVFQHFGIVFPIVMPRNFAMVMDFPMVRKFKKTGLEVKDLFEDKNYIFNHWILKNTRHNLSLSDSVQTASEIFEFVKSEAGAIDPTLGPMVSAEGKRMIRSLEKIEKKMLKAEKRRHAEKLNQIEAIKEALFPIGSLQERYDNFLNFYQEDSQFIQKLLHNFDPFDFQFNILSYLE